MGARIGGWFGLCERAAARRVARSAFERDFPGVSVARMSIVASRDTETVVGVFFAAETMPMEVVLYSVEKRTGLVNRVKDDSWYRRGPRR